MAIRRRLRRILWASILPVVSFALIGYFGFYSIYGEHGLLTLVTLKSQLEVAQTERDAIRSEREKLARRVVRMRPDSLDPDLLDEEARSSLGYMAPGEITIFDRGAGSSE